MALVGSAEAPARRIARLAPLFGTLALIGAGFLLTRSLVLGGLAGEYPNPAIRDVGFGTRVLTMLAVVPQWWRLLLLPWHLQADYMPVEIDRATTFGAAQALGLCVLFAWGFAAWRARRAYPVTTFGLGWVAVTLFPVSNLLLPTGILLAERTLFSPSVGAGLAVGGIAPWLGPRLSAAAKWERVVFAGFLLGLLLAWAARTASRVPVWKDDSVLARQTALDAPLSYRAHAVLGRVLFQAGDPAAGEREYRIAIWLYPHDPNVFAGLAKHFRDHGLHAPAIPLFRKALELAPQMIPARNMLIYSLAQVGDSAGAAAELTEKVRRGDPDAKLIRALLDSVQQSRQTAPDSGR
jgi:tetratricopeptide (TPR) repeat protein